MDGSSTHPAGKHRNVVGTQIWCPDDRFVLVNVGQDHVDLLQREPSRVSARGIVWLTIFMLAPPTSFLVFTKPRSGSIPVVSQSIKSQSCPLGPERTPANCECHIARRHGLHNPRHPWLHREDTPVPRYHRSRIADRRCLRSTSSIGSSQSLNAPMRAAIFALVA